MTKEIDHECTNEIVCPYCGNEFSDSWEYSSSDEQIGLIECGECEKSFYANRNITITYSTEKARYGTCKGCKSKKTIIEDYNSSIGRYKDLCARCGREEEIRLGQEYINNINTEIKEIDKCIESVRGD